MLDDVFEIEDGVLIEYEGEDEHVSVPEGVTRIGEYAFSGTSVVSVSIPEGVTHIEEGAFHACDRLTSVAIPKSVKYIGETAFGKCYALTEITIPNGVEILEKEVFLACESLTCVTIPDSVQIIDKSAFHGCEGLTQINFPKRMPDIHAFAFAGCKGLVDKDGFVIVDDVLYDYFGKNIEIQIPHGVKKIDNFTFPNDQRCVYCVTIPDSVTEIGEKAFVMSEPFLATIPASVTKIGENAFYCACVTFRVPAGSYVQQYAEENKIAYILLQDQPQRKGFWERFGAK